MGAAQPQLIGGKPIKAKGFTLVELFVVISIIAMLMGIFIPALSAVRRIARKTICKLNLYSCSLAFRMYLDDNKNVMPFAVHFPTLPSLSERALNLKPIGTVLAEYIGNQKVLKCPADEFRNTNSTYFEQEGSSYRYNTDLGGIRLNEGQITFRRRGRNSTVLLGDVDILSDYSGFHAEQNADGSYPDGAYVHLYADLLVADGERR